MLNLRLLANEGCEVISCKWFKNSIPIGNDFSYSAGDKSSDRLDANAIYTFELLTNQGVKYSTNKVISKTVLLAYPNPVSSGYALKIEGIDTGSPIEVYNLNGICVYRTITVDSPAILILNVPAGVYLVRSNNGELKVVIDK